jgi:PAS domain-containing protein
MSPPSLSPPELLSASVILDALAEGTLMIDAGNRVVWINRPLERLLGIDRDAFHSGDADRFMRRYLASVISDEACRKQILQSLHDKADISPLACNLRLFDRREHQIFISSVILQEEPFRGMRLVRLQTGLPGSEPRHPKPVESAAEGSEAAAIELRNLAGSQSKGIWMVDEDARITFINDMMAEMLGYSVAEMVGRPLAEFLTEEGKDRLVKLAERRRGERGLQVHRRLLETVIENIPIGVSLIQGTDLRIVLINPAYQAIAPGKEMVGKTLDEVWPEMQRTFADLQMSAAGYWRLVSRTTA